MEFQPRCGHHNCDCPAITCIVDADGRAWETPGGWEIELGQVYGLPEGWASSDLDPEALERIHVGLVQAADKRALRIESLPRELERVASSLHRALLIATDPNTRDVRPSEQLGAVLFGVERAVEKLSELAKGAA